MLNLAISGVHLSDKIMGGPFAGGGTVQAFVLEEPRCRQVCYTCPPWVLWLVLEFGGALLDCVTDFDVLESRCSILKEGRPWCVNFIKWKWIWWNKVWDTLYCVPWNNSAWFSDWMSLLDSVYVFHLKWRINVNSLGIPMGPKGRTSEKKQALWSTFGTSHNSQHRRTTLQIQEHIIKMSASKWYHIQGSI